MKNIQDKLKTSLELKGNVSPAAPKVVAVIPCYKVKQNILGVIDNICASVSRIYIVDDACPDDSGKYVLENCIDDRVCIIFHLTNLGVGGAMKTGYKAALKDGADIVIKLDGDGQMDTSYIPKLLEPIIARRADYTKGNRFYKCMYLKKMPKLRLFGNFMLSLLNKIASGYWNIMDPTNGFTAIHIDALQRLSLEKINNRYFFESDMLCNLGILDAMVEDIPMPAYYGNETSNLKISLVIFEFPSLLIARYFRRRIGF